MANILLLGLDYSVADELGRVLRQLGQSVSVAPQDYGAAESEEADVIFAGSGDLRNALAMVPRKPVIVTSRLPEVKAWLSALENGAADYCGAPFEAIQVKWLLASALAA
jgi:hypothetical protein